MSERYRANKSISEPCWRVLDGETGESIDEVEYTFAGALYTQNAKNNEADAAAAVASKPACHCAKRVRRLRAALQRIGSSTRDIWLATAAEDTLVADDKMHADLEKEEQELRVTDINNLTARLKDAEDTAERYRHALSQIIRFTDCRTASRYAAAALFIADRMKGGTS